MESAASEHLYDDSVDHQHFIEIGLDEALNELLTTPDSASEIFEPPPRHHKHQLSPLPYETSAHKNSASETLPSRKNSGTPGNYDWDAITANLDMIQSSMHNWDKIEEQLDTVISDLPIINTDTNAIGFNANGFFFDGEPLSPGRKQLPANTQMISPTQNHQPAQANHASNPFDSVPLNSKKSHGYPTSKTYEDHFTADSHLTRSVTLPRSFYTSSRGNSIAYPYCSSNKTAEDIAETLNDCLDGSRAPVERSTTVANKQRKRFPPKRFRFESRRT